MSVVEAAVLPPRPGNDLGEGLAPYPAEAAAFANDENAQSNNHNYFMSVILLLDDGPGNRVCTSVSRFDSGILT